MIVCPLAVDAYVDVAKRGQSMLMVWPFVYMFVFFIMSMME